MNNNQAKYPKDFIPRDVRDIYELGGHSFSYLVENKQAVSFPEFAAIINRWYAPTLRILITTHAFLLLEGTLTAFFGRYSFHIQDFRFDPMDFPKTFDPVKWPWEKTRKWLEENHHRLIDAGILHPLESYLNQSSTNQVLSHGQNGSPVFS